MRSFIFRLTKKYNLKAYIITAVVLLSFYSLTYLLKNSDVIVNKTMELTQLDIKLKNIKILGIENTNPTEVINIMSGLKETSLSNIDLHEISTKINNIDWIKKSELRKIYPSTLVVKVYEHNPIAIWFNNGNKFLVDDESQIIKELNPNNFKNLKVIAGPNALEDIPEIISMIRNYPEFE